MPDFKNKRLRAAGGAKKDASQHGLILLLTNGLLILYNSSNLQAAVLVHVDFKLGGDQ
jgi:hypothetical protein